MRVYESANFSIIDIVVPPFAAFSYNLISQFVFITLYTRMKMIFLTQSQVIPVIKYYDSLLFRKHDIDRFS